MPLTDAEITQTVALLKKLEAGADMPLTIFHEFARLQCLSIVELVPLRIHDGKTEVLLLKRPADDPHFTGWHTPGRIVRQQEAANGLAGVQQRLIETELSGVIFNDSPRYVTTVIHASERGSECSAIFYATVTENNGIGEWYDIDNLPPDLVRSQLDFLPKAFEQFKREYAGSNG